MSGKQEKARRAAARIIATDFENGSKLPWHWFSNQKVWKRIERFVKEIRHEQSHLPSR